jgi:hypothetical protein
LQTFAVGNKPVQEYFTVKLQNVQLYEKFVDNSRPISCVALKFKISPEKSTSLSRTGLSLARHGNGNFFWSENKSRTSARRVAV